MDAREAAQGLFDFWVLGAVMLYLIATSKYSKMLRVTKAGSIRVARVLLMATLARVIYVQFVAAPQTLDAIKSAMDFVPWETMPGVFWEDACYVLPLALLAKMYGSKKLFKYLLYPLLVAAVSLSFGSGHIYEGTSAAITLSFYVPFMLKFGKKYGFGTVIMAHVLYDLITHFTFKLMLG